MIKLNKYDSDFKELAKIKVRLSKYFFVESEYREDLIGPAILGSKKM